MSTPVSSTSSVPVERLGQRPLGAVVVALAEEREDATRSVRHARVVDRLGWPPTAKTVVPASSATAARFVVGSGTKTTRPGRSRISSPSTVKRRAARGRSDELLVPGRHLVVLRRPSRAPASLAVQALTPNARTSNACAAATTRLRHARARDRRRARLPRHGAIANDALPRSAEISISRGERAAAARSSSTLNVADSSRLRFAPSASSSSAKIARASGVHAASPAATARRATRAAPRIRRGVEDTAHDELRRDGAVPAVLLQPERDVVALLAAGSGRAARPCRTRSPSRRRGRAGARGSAGACRRRRSTARRPRSRRRAARRRDCRCRTARAAAARRRGRARASRRERSRRRASPAQVLLRERRVRVRRERRRERLDALGARSSARRRHGGRRSASGAPSTRRGPPCRSNAGTDRPEPFHSPSVPAIITTGRL